MCSNMKEVLLALGLLVGDVSIASAQVDDSEVFNHLSINVGVSTEGVTAGIAIPITPYLELYGGANLMPGIKIKGDVDINAGTISVPNLMTMGMDTYNLQSMQLEGNLARSTFDAKLSIYPAGRGFPLFLVGGLSFGGKTIGELKGHSAEVEQLYREHPEYQGDISAMIDQYEIAVDHQGYAKGEVNVKSVRPYVGLGFGRQVPKHRVGFRIEAGCQFMGKLKICQNGQELNKTLTDHIDGTLSDIIEKVNVYPVLRLTLTGRLF